MKNGKIIVAILILSLGIPVGALAGGKVPGQPFEYLQEQINTLAQQIRNLESRVAPPTITYTPTCIDTFSLDIDLNFTDDNEIAYYAIQEQGGNPPMNIIVFVEPGLATANYSLTVDPGPGVRKLLFIAADTDGNVSKSLFQIDPDICFGPCPGGVICP